MSAEPIELSDGVVVAGETQEIIGSKIRAHLADKMREFFSEDDPAGAVVVMETDLYGDCYSAVGIQAHPGEDSLRLAFLCDEDDLKSDPKYITIEDRQTLLVLKRMIELATDK